MTSLTENPTLHSAWGSFENMVVPKDAPDVQRVAMEMAFYAGAKAFSVLLEFCLSQENREAGAQMARTLDEELELFVDRMNTKPRKRARRAA